MDLLALLGGALVPYALAPYNYWGFSLIAPALLLYCLRHASAKQALWRSFVFGLGMFGRGTSWVYVSIHEFGGTDMPLAIVMTSIFVSGLALVFALPFFLFKRYFPSNFLNNTVGFTAVWVLGEWLRSWFLTGFPWLYLGYAHIDTWLAGWAPIFGVFALSFISVFTGSLVLEVGHSLLQKKRLCPLQWTGIATLISSWGLGLVLLPSSPSLSPEADPTDTQTSISVALVQPNIPLEQKWDPLYQHEIMEILRDETSLHWNKDLIVWPEASIPLMYHDAEFFLEEIEDVAKQTNTGVITGILYDDDKPMTFYNSIIGLGRADGIYFKQRLVPFGEYVPLEEWLRGLINFFNLPNSIIFAGPKDQNILSFDTFKVAPSICYEIVYPDLVAKLADTSNLIITISNDAWFGSSIGPHQHFEMAQMRALENARHVIRSTNTGISGIIGPDGKVLVKGRQFVRETIAIEALHLNTGKTLFSSLGSKPIVLFCCLLISGLIVKIRVRRRNGSQVQQQTHASPKR